MSNLNINNIDVQRIINILVELKAKTEICSFLTIRSMERIIASQDEIRPRLKKPNILGDLVKHFDYMLAFKNKHLIIKEEVKEGEKNPEADEEQPSGEQDKENIELEKEKENLDDIDEKKDEITKDLAKSTRAICRSLYQNDHDINILKEYRVDQDIAAFGDGFLKLLDNNIKRVKMTIEEQNSERELQVYLNKRIHELEFQIKEKKIKYEKLVADHSDFKKNFSTTNNEINKEIETINNNTKSFLQKLEDDINKDIYEKEIKSKENISKLNAEYQGAKDDFEKKKAENEGGEGALHGGFQAEENKLKAFINEYDGVMDEFKQEYTKQQKNNNALKVNLESEKILRDNLREKFLTYQFVFRKDQDRRKGYDHTNDQKSKAMEWVQAHIRGFFTRKDKAFKKIKPLVKDVKKRQTVDIPYVKVDPNAKGGAKKK